MKNPTRTTTIKASNSGKDHKKKLVTLDPRSLRKLSETKDFLQQTYGLDVSEGAILRRALDNYHWFTRYKLQGQYASPNTVVDEPNKIYRVAQPG